MASLLAGCAQTSPSPTSVTAPTLSAPEPAPAPKQSDSAVAPGPEPVASAGPGGDVDAGADARFRACRSDADCVAVPRAGCCHNGWKEAVAASQKDAYAQANACTATRRPICPMFIVNDTRVARCDAASKLCTLVQP